MMPVRAALFALLERLRDPAGGTSERVDPEMLAKVAERHGVAVLASRSLQAEELRPLVRAATDRSMVLARQLRTLVEALSSAGIDVLPIKGPVLALTAYGDPAARGISGDLDLVVRPRDFDRALAILTQKGYTRNESAIDEHDHEQRQTEAHLFPPAVPAAMVELHTELIGNFYTAPVDLDAVMSRCSSKVLFGVRMFVPAAEDLFLYLALHGARHAWSRLLWLCDIRALLQAAQIDWTILRQRAASIDAERRVALALRLANELLAVPVPQDWKHLCGGLRMRWTVRVAVRRMIETAAGKRAPGLWMRLATELAMRETATQQLTYAKRQLEPNARDRAWIALPRGLQWLRFALRPVRLLTRYGAGIEKRHG